MITCTIILTGLQHQHEQISAIDGVAAEDVSDDEGGEGSTAMDGWMDRPTRAMVRCERPKTDERRRGVDRLAW